MIRILESRLHKELLQLNSVFTEIAQFKNGPKICTFIQKRYSTQVANKHMKMSSVSLAIREMQIKTTVWNHFTSTRMAGIKQVLRRIWRKWNPPTMMIGMKCYSCFGSQGVPQWFNSPVTLWPSKYTPPYILKRSENMSTQKLV